MTSGAPDPAEGRPEPDSSTTDGADAASSGSENGHTEPSGGRAETGTSEPDDSPEPEDSPEPDNEPDDGIGDGFAVNERFETGYRTEERKQIRILEDRVEQLSTVCEAMWHVMSQELGIELSELATKLTEINGEGLISVSGELLPSSVCPNCGNNKPTDVKLCLFCTTATPTAAADR